MIDIIIPTYNNINGLRKTLNSIPKQHLDQLNVTVIDDCSITQYAQINEQYPFINFIRLEKNVGPGMARQNGINNTFDKYILFIDTGDYFLPNVFPKILQAIEAYPNLPIFVWKFIRGKKQQPTTSNQLHGHIYKREFLNKYNISFCPYGSYANEDIGFNYTCNLFLKNNNLSYYVDETPIMMYDATDINSLTKKDNNAFIYREQNIYFAYNIVHAYNIGKNNGVKEDLLREMAISGILSEYYWYLRAKFDRKEFLTNALQGAKYYYDNLYNKYKDLPISQEIVIARLFHHYGKQWRAPEEINVSKFIKMLASNS